VSGWLLKLALAGVQELIAEARKTRDLAAGSLLISRAARAAADVAAGSGGTLVLPARPDSGGASFPNQLLVSWPNGEPQQVRQWAEAMERAARQELSAATDTCFTIDRTDLDRAIHRQIEDAVEVYWVALPLTDGAYETTFKQVQQLLEERKRSRTFAQLAELPDGCLVWSCKLCGKRPAVVVRQSRDNGIARGLVLDDRAKIRLGDDTLCAVCAGKRLWSFSDTTGLGGFPSTHRLARWRLWTAGRDDPELHALLTERDGDGEQLIDGDQERLEAALGKAWRHLLQPAYYAVVMVDGDHMGRWLGGEGEYRRQDEPLERHQEQLSAALAGFAGAIHRQADTCGARVVYAGGDDALILCPIDGLMPLLSGIDDSWQQATASIRGRDGRQPTITAHASVVHAKASLQPVLIRARQKLQQSKDDLDRNGLSIMADLHAGGSTTAMLRWPELDQLGRAVEGLSAWRAADQARCPGAGEIRRRSRQALPARLPHSLLQQTRSFFGPLASAFDRDALALEVERVYRQGAGQDADTEAWARLKGWLLEQRDTYRPAPRHRPGPKVKAGDAFASVLAVTAFLARQLDWEVGR
jgi:CRISPR-associated protein Cmr2